VVRRQDLSIEKTTSALVTGAPSWKVAGRSVKV
jgi:hypothetical protein